MKSSLSIAALLGAGSVFASAERREGQVKEIVVLTDSLLKGKDLPSRCSSGFTLTVTVPFQESTPSEANFDFFGFCSDFMQPTATVVKTQTQKITTTISSTVTSFKQATVTDTTPVATTTVLCPVPSSVAPVCGSAAWGYAENNIYSGTADAAACHQLCLGNPACQSFQAQNSSYTNPSCNLYKVSAGGNNTIVGAAPFMFYDWDCGDYLPAACGNVVPPGGGGRGSTSASTRVAATYTAPTYVPPVKTSTTTDPPYTLPTNPPAVPPGAPDPTTSTTAIFVTITKTVTSGRQATTRGSLVIVPRYATLPPFLTPFGSSSISDVCGCVITSASPTEYRTTTKKVTAVNTVGAVITTTVNGGTTTVGGGGYTTTIVSSVT